MKLAKCHAHVHISQSTVISAQQDETKCLRFIKFKAHCFHPAWGMHTYEYTAEYMTKNEVNSYTHT